MLRLAALTCVAVLIGGAGEALAATDGSTPASPSIVRQVTHVSAHTLNAVGAGGIKANQGPQKSGAFTVVKLHSAKRGKLPVLFAAELAWCPHCAADSWALAVALSRFGTLHGLRQIDTGTYFSSHTGASPLFDHIQGLSFAGATYSSRLLGLADVTLQDTHGKAIAKLSPAQKAELAKFDKSGFVPAFDVAGRWGMVNSAFSPLVLHGQSAALIAARTADGTSVIGQDIDGFANVLTAAICSSTAGQPKAVCASAGVRAGAKVL